LELLAERGLTVGMDTVKFDDVIRVADARRASAYRAWSGDDADAGSAPTPTRTR